MTEAEVQSSNKAKTAESDSPAKSRKSRSKSAERRKKEGRSKEPQAIPSGLKNAISFFLTAEQQKLMLDLCSEELGQSHLFEAWDEAEKVSPSVLRQMVSQLESLDASYPGGLREYILTAKRLLEGTYIQ